MAEYRKHEAREWGKDDMKGVAINITPKFTQYLRGLNEKAICKHFTALVHAKVSRHLVVRLGF